MQITGKQNFMAPIQSVAKESSANRSTITMVIGSEEIGHDITTIT